ncbi:hypothetical protein EDD85DRAFT_963160 [Armillaria nabsnona]|nr:hypothetical protein EDD85DRAFT_963160 [Armillaria nabsnona]
MSTSLSPTDLKFGTADGKLWTRRLYGQEAQAAYFVDHGEGFTMYAGTLDRSFHTSPFSHRARFAYSKSLDQGAPSFPFNCLQANQARRPLLV